jgi:hypothetical protein
MRSALSGPLLGFFALHPVSEQSGMTHDPCSRGGFLRTTSRSVASATVTRAFLRTVRA